MSEPKPDPLLKGRLAVELDTPALYIDLDRMDENIRRSASLADSAGFELRPHVKTHKMPPIARLQVTAGAVGVTAAKLGEAEVMAEAGVQDIFIAHLIVGEPKLRRLRALARSCRMAVGVDLPEHAEILSAAFRDEDRPLDVLIEVDTGQGRQGRPTMREAVRVAELVHTLPQLHLRGIFTHEGQDYEASSPEGLAASARKAQTFMVETADAIRKATGQACRVSVGSTPSLYRALMNGADAGYLPGIDEVRAGTYIFCDAAMAGILGHTDWCAASVLTMVVNRPAPDRWIIDAGAKALSIDKRPEGTLLHTKGLGIVEDEPGAVITGLSDEHGVIQVENSSGKRIGDKVRVIPTHICPTVNLYDAVYAGRDGVVETVWPVAARGRTR
ncbi:MAG: alanine racemase [Nitrospinota bacterium]|nr:alanine racemase [Nitrospinota bacterium]